MAFGRGNLAGGQYYVGDVVYNKNYEPYYEKKLTDKYTFDVPFNFKFTAYGHDDDYLYMYIKEENKIYKYSMIEHKIIASKNVPFELKYFRVYPYNQFIECGDNTRLIRLSTIDFSTKLDISLTGIDYRGTPDEIFYLEANRIMSKSYYEIAFFNTATKKLIRAITNDGRSREIKVFNNAVFISNRTGNMYVMDFNGNDLQTFRTNSSNRYFARLTELKDGSLAYSTEAYDTSVGADRSGIITPDGNKFTRTEFSTQRLRSIAEYNGYIYGHDYHVLYKHDRNFNRLQQWDLSDTPVNVENLLFSRENIPIIYKNKIFSFYNVVQTGYKIIN
ncbi:hypothetical protein LAV35_03545 [Clostridium sporogenes]|uniref:hypothetical protein n=1 Tax=Clostridium sporogenes TaxID=1509 RepID=UPI002237A1DF|nr:hypothetical protein [Clostridium sporogenes]MCW6059789.1 hypothetical protein [Clostridium sporogenes]MCW6067258.1 hypothetical protein [Clostridium sporogenes]